MTNPSLEQQTIFSHVETKLSTSLLIHASAGSGKTTTIVEAACRMPTSHMQRFLAFNKSIAAELSERLPKTCEASTFHSLGVGAIRASGRKVKVSGDKTRWIAKPLLTKKSELQTYMGAVCRLVGYAKNAGVGITAENTPSAWLDLIARYALDHEGDDARLVEVARRAFELSLSSHEIDFDDMLYWPVVFNLPFNRCSTVFVDEAQDTNVLQKEILRRMIFPSGRVIAVGDPSQAIYGFRGADSGALSSLVVAFNMETLPLSVSYRCSKAVVEEARKFDKGTI